MIYLMFTQYMKHRMQITQECWEYEFNDKLREVYTTNDCIIVSRWQGCYYLITTAVHLPDK